MGRRIVRAEKCQQADEVERGKAGEGCWSGIPCKVQILTKGMSSVVEMETQGKLVFTLSQ